MTPQLQRKVFFVLVAMALIGVTAVSRHPLDAAGISLLTFAGAVATPELLAVAMPWQVRSEELDAAQDTAIDESPSTGRSVRLLISPITYLARHPRLILLTFFAGVAVTIGGIGNAIYSDDVARSRYLLGAGYGFMWAALFAIILVRSIELRAQSEPVSKEAVRRWLDQQRAQSVLLLASAAFFAGTVTQLLATFRR
jgi:hypothetical protein